MGAMFGLCAGARARAVPGSEEPDLDLVFERDLAVPPHAVFAAWTDAAVLARWWGPHGTSNPVCEIDPRPGGRVRIHMAARDGTLFPCRGEVRQVRPPKRLVFTSTAEFGGAAMLLLLNEVDLAPAGAGTRLALRSRVLSSAPLTAARHRAGMRLVWWESLERLAAVVEA